MSPEFTNLPNLLLALFQVLMFMAYGVAQKLFQIKNMLILLMLVCGLGLILIFCFTKIFPDFTPENLDPMYILGGQCLGFILLFFLYRKAAP
jgi:formate hydrogenlyase subunit 4